MPSLQTKSPSEETKAKYVLEILFTCCIHWIDNRKWAIKFRISNGDIVLNNSSITAETTTRTDTHTVMRGSPQKRKAGVFISIYL